jgi:hypothetical protein
LGAQWDTIFLGQALVMQGGQLLHYALLQEDQDSPGALRETRLALDTLVTLQPSTELQTLTSTSAGRLTSSMQADGSVQLFWISEESDDDNFPIYQWAPGAQPREVAPDLYKGYMHVSLPRGSGSNLWFTTASSQFDYPRLVRLALDPTGAPLCLYGDDD